MSTAKKSDIDNLIAAFDAATNKIAARIQALADQLAASTKDGLTAEETADVRAKLVAEVAKLNAMGADATDPLPAALEPQETTPILD